MQRCCVMGDSMLPGMLLRQLAPRGPGGFIIRSKIYRVSQKEGSFVKLAILGALKAFLRHTLQLVAHTNNTRTCPGTTGNTLVSLQCTLQPLEAIQ